MIVVIDSGVLISALHFAGTPREALEGVQTAHQMVFCPAIDFEVRTKLLGKFGWENAAVDVAVRRLFLNATLVEPTGTLIGLCRDRKDDIILECALMANAQTLISSDKDLLAEHPFRSIEILTPRSFVDRHRQ